MGIYRTRHTCYFVRFLFIIVPSTSSQIVEQIEVFKEVFSPAVSKLND